jgi:hypothetical protein
MDGSLYAFDLKITRDLFANGQLPQFSDAAVKWRYRTSKAISIPAIPGDNAVVFASRNGSLYSVTKEDRKLLFQFETDAPLTAPVVRYRDKLLLASEDFNFYSLNMRSGKPGWQFTAGVVIRKAPVLIDDEVYLFPDHGNMFKLSAESGHTAWSVPRMQDFLAASTDRVYVADRHNNFTILSRDHGEVLGFFPLGQFTKHLANEHSDRIYLATESGLVMCLHEQRSEFARFHMHPDRQPILPDFAAEGPAGQVPADMDAAGDMPADDGDKPDAEKPEDEKPDADKPDDESPATEKPEADDEEVENPAAEKPEEE